MSADKAKEKQAEHHVFGQLLKRGVLPYRTAGGGIRVNTPAGCRLELRVVLRQAQDERQSRGEGLGHGAGEECRFAVAEFRPRPELFFLCVEFCGGEISGIWVFPSTSFLVYSIVAEERGCRELNLDARQKTMEELSLREYCSFFRNRWEPVAQYDLYRSFMRPWNSPDFADGWENFEDEMMALEAIENREPRSESIPIEEIVFSDAAALAN